MRINKTIPPSLPVTTAVTGIEYIFRPLNCRARLSKSRPIPGDEALNLGALYFNGPKYRSSQAKVSLITSVLGIEWPVS
jgi:hypothetical protein